MMALIQVSYLVNNNVNLWVGIIYVARFNRSENAWYKSDKLNHGFNSMCQCRNDVYTCSLYISEMRMTTHFIIFHIAVYPMLCYLNGLYNVANSFYKIKNSTVLFNYPVTMICDVYNVSIA